MPASSSRTRACFELSRAARRPARGRGRRRAFPHRVTYHPTCHSLRVAHVGDAPLRLLRAVRGTRAGRAAGGRASAAASAARSRSRTPRRRRRCWPTSARRDPATRRRGLHRRRRLVPAADRRRRSRGAEPACARCTSPRSSPRDELPRAAARAHSATRSCAATCATRRPRSATSEPASSPRFPTGRSCAKRDARSRPT